MEENAKNCADCIYLRSVVDSHKTEVISDNEKYARMHWKHECKNVYVKHDVVSLNEAKTCPHYEEDI